MIDAAFIVEQTHNAFTETALLTTGPLFGLTIRGRNEEGMSTRFVERNGHFRDNPKRAGKRIWDIDFLQDMEAMNSGNHREW